MLPNLRQAYGERVVHIHLVAPEKELAQRYKARKPEGFQEFRLYGQVKQDPTEKQVYKLAEPADIIIDLRFPI